MPALEDLSRPLLRTWSVYDNCSPPTPSAGFYDPSCEQSVASARAAVLVYDDHNKKWVPSGSSSGLSKVHIYQHTVNGTFRIVGRKLHDHEVVINCAILKGLKYSQATGTFHQWRDNRTVYGLNFSSKDDADNFAVAMLRAIDMLNQNSSTGPRVQPAPPPVPQHASQPIYQTIGSVAQQEDTDHQRNWQNQQPVHYMATNAVGSSSHPATPASGPPQAPPQAPPFPQAPPQLPQQPQANAVMGHHRTSSAPGTNGGAPPPPPPGGTSGMSVAVGSVAASGPPPAPAPPPSGGMASGGAPPPPPPPPPPGGSQGREDDSSPLSLAAALANAKLKKTSNKIYEGTDTLKKGSGGVPMMGMASMIDEMRGTLAKRRAQAENSQSQEAESSTDSRRTWDKQGSTNGNSPSKVAASGAESPKSGRGQRIGSLGDTDVMKVNGVDVLDMDKLKQEIMSEIRREVSKMKQDIIEAIKIELNRR
ncbi:protein enabled isoform X1 [Dermacentor silvarum]|uniref:protein enabled isoform X1 n=1 Tax=Dermacentor silvarum TaxID=543639 RepID=UPI0018996A4D|nr:protein enabled isoform X1 [Dermacentor silvarum]